MNKERIPSELIGAFNNASHFVNHFDLKDELRKKFKSCNEAYRKGYSDMHIISYLIEEHLNTEDNKYYYVYNSILDTIDVYQIGGNK